MAQYTPTILAFVCNWCSYGGADQAGAAKLACPANVRLMRVMCSGRIDPQLIVQTLRDGADGVMVLGCHPGDCHYKKGNYNTLRRTVLLKRLLEQFGIEPERVCLDWVSASEGEKFSRVTSAMNERITRLGPFQRDNAEIKKIAAAK